MVPLVGLLVGLQMVINEVCYDPPGSDTGAEFIEIFNPDSVAVSLAGCRLEFGNGAGDGTWEHRWTAGADDRLPPRSCFLVADAGWSGPAPDAQVALALQNGPDAVRLVRPDGSVDTVGWGDLEPDGLYEGRPAVDVTGLALARRPDGRDTGVNADDLVAAVPTPGALNWPDFAPRLDGWRWQPPVGDGPAAPVTGTFTIRNAGRRDLVGGTLTVRMDGEAGSAVLGSVPADSAGQVTVTVSPPRAGRQPVSVCIALAAAADTFRWEAGCLQVGPAGVQLAEVMAAPAAGGEWCEVVNADVVPRNLADLALRDEDGAWRGLPDLVLAPGDCRLLAQDAEALGRWLADLVAAGAPLACEPAPPLAVPGWPSLNNTAPADRAFADRLYLAAADGTVIDYVTVGLGSRRAPAGRSLERGSDRRWRPATAPAGGTPGCLPAPAPSLATGEVRLTPNPFSRTAGDGAVHAHLVVPPTAQGWEMRIYDLWGRRVRDLGGDDLGPGSREVVWDGRDEAGSALPVGGYVAVVMWRTGGGGVVTAARRLVVIREAGP